MASKTSETMPITDNGNLYILAAVVLDCKSLTTDESFSLIITVCDHVRVQFHNHVEHLCKTKATKVFFFFLNVGIQIKPQ